MQIASLQIAVSRKTKLQKSTSKNWVYVIQTWISRPVALTILLRYLSLYFFHVYLKTVTGSE